MQELGAKGELSVIVNREILLPGRREKRKTKLEGAFCLLLLFSSPF